MGKQHNRYKQMERYMTMALALDVVLFLLFLIYSGAGVIWVKVITAIFSMLLSAAGIAFLYMSKELLRPRSLWMTTAFVSIIVCVLFSLILGFPSPRPL